MTMYRYEKAAGQGWMRARGYQGWAETRAKAMRCPGAVRVYAQAGELVWEGPGSECPELAPAARRVEVGASVRVVAPGALLGHEGTVRERRACVDGGENVIVDMPGGVGLAFGDEELEVVEGPARAPAGT